MRCGRRRWRQQTPTRGCRCWRSVRTAAGRRSGSATSRNGRARSSTRSIITVARRRIRPAGNITISTSSTRGPARWTPSRSSARRSTMPDWSTRWWRSSVVRPWSPRHGRRPCRSCSSMAGTVRNRPASTTKDGRRMLRWAARWRSTTCSLTLPAAAARPTSRSSCQRSSRGASRSQSATGSLRVLTRVD